MCDVDVSASSTNMFGGSTIGLCVTADVTDCHW